MRYLIIEHFKKDKILELYQRFDKKGRMLPKGVTYINSWIDENIETCYQIMESESLEKLQDWIANWNDLADFEIIPVLTSAEAKTKILNKDSNTK